jgi:hypothetical protein
LVALALGAGVEGAAAVGGVAGLGAGAVGVVVCASALVNAKPLTAATAMILLSMCASCGRLCEEGRWSPKSRRPVEETPEPRTCSRFQGHIRAAIPQAALTIPHARAIVSRPDDFSCAIDSSGAPKRRRPSNVNAALP